MDGRFKMGSSLTVCGPSQSGKTIFVCNLLKAHKLMFSQPIGSIHWFCGILQKEVINQIRTSIGQDIKTYQGLPDNFDVVKPRDVIVLDDLQEEALNSQIVTNLFTKVVHHRNCFLINIVQNLFLKGRDSRTRTLNTHYLVLFKNPRDTTQITCLSRQMQLPFLPAAFEDATNQGPYSYLLLDFRQETPDSMRIRTRILPHEANPQYVYMYTEKAKELINKRAI